MAIEIPEKPQLPGGRAPGGRAPEASAARPWWRRPAIHTGVVGAVLGYFLGHWLGNLIAGGYVQVQNSGQNDFAIILGYVFGTVGWLAGLGVFNDLLRQMAGRPVHADE
jgi:cytochrome c oxidase subunit I